MIKLHNWSKDRWVEEEEEKILQAKSREDATSEVTIDLESQINAISGDWRPLAESERAYFEPRFGADFDPVRVHTDAKAAEVVRAVNAWAFTMGKDVIFGAGQYALGASDGRRMMAHELTHMVQQGDADSIIQRQKASQCKRYLRDIPVPKLDAYGIPSWKFEETEEYKSYMNPNFKWQLEYSVTKEESLLACRLIVNDRGSGKRVNWKKEAFSYIKQARGELSKKEKGTEGKEEGTEKGILKDCGEFEDAQAVITGKLGVGPVDLEIQGYHKGICCAYLGARVIFLKWPKERPPLRKNVRWGRSIEYTENDPPPSMEERKNACKEFVNEMKVLLDREWVYEDAIRISKELRKRHDMLFTFMKFEDVSWHNNDAERAIRQGVLHLKISGGRRTWNGAEVFEVILSVYETSKKRGQRCIGMVKKRFEQSLESEIQNVTAS